MDYHAGDTVMHWVHGLGKVIRREKRDVLGHQAIYYAVHVGNMIVWVPVDDKVSQRLRPPTLSWYRLRSLRGSASVRSMASTGQRRRHAWRGLRTYICGFGLVGAGVAESRSAVNRFAGARKS